MLADWNIHWDTGNPHVHVLLTMRELTEEGFGKRVTEWNRKDYLKVWRESWADYTNFHLRLHQHEVQIDHRSYQDQGLDLIPSIHEGKAVTDMARRGLFVERLKEANQIRQENLIRIRARPELLFQKVTRSQTTFSSHQVGAALGAYLNDRGLFSSVEESGMDEPNAVPASVLTPQHISSLLHTLEHHESVFQEADLAKAVSPYTANATLFAKALLEVKASPELIALGVGDDGRPRYTTRAMFQLENALQAEADTLRKRRHHLGSPVKQQFLMTAYQRDKKIQLAEEQQAAISYVLKPNAIRCLVGRAGTGKSFSLGAARYVWENQGLRVLGLALSGIAADGLQKDAGITSRTIESFRYALRTGQLTLNRKDVVVLDEAGMCDSPAMLAVLKAVKVARAKLVLVGDPAQLQPVGPGASFRALLERLDFAELQTVYRQKVAWQRAATQCFSDGQLEKGLRDYEAREYLKLKATEEEALALLTQEWAKAYQAAPEALSELLAITYRNRDVDVLNSRLRAVRVQAGALSEGARVHTVKGPLEIAVGERLLFLKNDRALGVSNGRFGTVTEMKRLESGQVTQFSVRLDGQTHAIDIHPERYADFTYGYAATVHKTQGLTVNQTFVYAGSFGWNRFLTYVALSRHRLTATLYAPQTVFPTVFQLKKQLSRWGLKDSVLDFPAAFQKRRGLTGTGGPKALLKHLAGRLRDFKENIQARVQAVWAFNRSIPSDLGHSKGHALSTERQAAQKVAEYVELRHTAYLLKKAVQSRLEGLRTETASFGKTRGVKVSSLPEYQAYQAAKLDVAVKAAELLQEPTRYEKALSRANLSLVSLKKNGAAYASGGLKWIGVSSKSRVQSIFNLIYRTIAANPTLSCSFAKRRSKSRSTC